MGEAAGLVFVQSEGGPKAQGFFENGCNDFLGQGTRIGRRAGLGVLEIRRKQRILNAEKPPFVLV
ncbi:MAG: hypothetical protein AMJ58_12575 [Gammaproteobacteria bacterium SG8_30]|nr:MAG: hypothetical protein AMJ58_12575 [Gammaproteobacteria bacterium SG8_30]